LNAPSATGSIRLNATGPRAGFRASCDRQNNLTRRPFGAARKKTTPARGRAEAVKVGGVYQCRLMPGGWNGFTDPAS
jgi:hypothetical protein